MLHHNSSEEPIEMNGLPPTRPRPVPRPPAVPPTFATLPAPRDSEPNTCAADVPTPALLAKKKRPKPRHSAAARHACQSKVRYKDEIKAKFILSQTGGGRHTRRGKDEKRAYPCDVCNGWHLTSRETWGLAGGPVNP